MLYLGETTFSRATKVWQKFNLLTSSEYRLTWLVWVIQGFVYIS